MFTESSIYLARARYRKLANRYHPDKNPYRREYALKVSRVTRYHLIVLIVEVPKNC